MEFLRRLYVILFGASSGVPTLPSEAWMMTPYTCTVTTEPGQGPQDAQAHHVKDAGGKLVSFQNPHPSFGFFGQMTFFQGLSMFIRQERFYVQDPPNLQSSVLIHTETNTLVGCQAQIHRTPKYPP